MLTLLYFYLQARVMLLNTHHLLSLAAASAQCRKTMKEEFVRESEVMRKKKNHISASTNYFSLDISIF